MKLLGVTAHNVGGIESIQWDVEGHHLWLVGGENGSGKTSAVRALLLALCGRSGASIPDPALKIGEKTGWIRVNLSDNPSSGLDALSIEMELERRANGTVKETLRVLNSSGEEAASPRKLLQDLYASKALDPSVFDRMDKSTRRKTLIELAGLDIDAFNAELSTLNAERKAADGILKKMTAAAEAAGEGVDENAPDQEIDVSNLLAIIEQNEEERWEINQDKATLHELEQALEEAKKAYEAAQESLKAFLKKSKHNNTPPPDTGPMREQLAKSSEINEAVRKKRRWQESLKEKELAAAELASAQSMLKECVEKHELAIAQAQWPVPGLSIDNDGVVYNGVPYELLNTAKRMYLSASIAIALNPTLRLLVIENGSEMDKTTLAELDALLKQHNFQAIVEVVTRNPQDDAMCSVVIKDGKQL